MRSSSIRPYSSYESFGGLVTVGLLLCVSQFDLVVGAGIVVMILRP